MAGKGTGRWMALLAASFVAHTALTVNSTEVALWNSQGRQGALLAQQLAEAAAPLALARDMVSLSVLASRYEDHPGIESVRLYNSQRELLTDSGQTGRDGRLFTAAIQLQQQALGRVELRLYTPGKADIVRASMGNILLSGALHLMVLMAGLMLRQPVANPAGATRPGRHQTMTPASAPTSAAISPVRENTPISMPLAESVLHLALDDGNGLLTRVNAAMADELLSVLDQFIDRAARLYGGHVDTPFSPQGVVVRFRQPDTAEREFHALAAARLFLQLVEDSMEERRRHGRLCLGAKAGIVHGEADAELAALLAQMAPADRILCTLPESTLAHQCRFGSSHKLDTGTEAPVTVALLESFTSDYQQLIQNQSLQILGPTETA